MRILVDENIPNITVHELLVVMRDAVQSIHKT